MSRRKYEFTDGSGNAKNGVYLTLATLIVVGCTTSAEYTTAPDTEWHYCDTVISTFCGQRRPDHEIQLLDSLAIVQATQGGIDCTDWCIPENPDYPICEIHGAGFKCQQ